MSQTHFDPWRVLRPGCALLPCCPVALLPKEIGGRINKIIARLADANESLKGAIDVADFNNAEKLGRGKAMVDRLTKLAAIFEGLEERLAEDLPTLLGIDHGFSFPLRYFEVHRLVSDWPAFLEDFQPHWPMDGDYT